MSTRNRTGVPAAVGPDAILTSRAWKRQAILPPAVLSVAASSSTVQSPSSAHSLSLSPAGTV